MNRIEQLINRYFHQKASADELRELDAWMAEASNKQTLTDYLKIWLWTGQLEQKQPDIKLEDTWSRIQERQTVGKARKLIMKTFLRYAAVIIILLNVGWWGARAYYVGAMDPEGQVFSVSANRLNNSLVTLPDQTLVYLRPGTNLQYDSRFNKKHRQVTLDGEAYFEVARDEANPFTVITSHARVNVLGTRFNVCARQESSVVQTTLVEGKVEFVTGEGEKYLLEPDQMLELNSETSTVKVTQVNTDLYTAWKDGKVIFRNATLGEITRRLEEIYHVKFRYKNQSLADNYRFSGTFHYETSIGDVITMLKISIPMEVKRVERFPEPDLIYLE
ncbi:FecR family protein [Gaoshiqia sediminis]|uniref:FecR domain-containing protein n=1 Tax=Gaoshiqia sediminis TaxID=2986998 RepID=A0AA42C8V6_9BACT|nr:FecR domain-containing protein [Gaoshiqia sediminis]MCW0481325.1 FecR domain-containing protein [Gaoshiqia sediminis]